MGKWLFEMGRGKKIWFGKRTVGWLNPQYSRRSCLYPVLEAAEHMAWWNSGREGCDTQTIQQLQPNNKKMPGGSSGRASTMRNVSYIPGEQS
jgi:hypothetical protein